MKILRTVCLLLTLAAVLLCTVSCSLGEIIGNAIGLAVGPSGSSGEPGTSAAQGTVTTVPTVTTAGNAVTTVPSGTTAGTQNPPVSGTTAGQNEPPVEPGVMTELDPSSYYGYTYLAGLNQPGLLWLYRLLVENADVCAAKIPLGGGTYQLTKDEVSTVYHCYIADYPQHFWMGGSYTYEYDTGDGHVTSLSPDYLVEKARIPAMKAEFSAAVDAMLAGIDLLPDDYARECEIHDRIVLNAQYDSTYGAPMTHSAYGNLVNKTSVCDGYAKLFQYLMYRCGILCLQVSGYAGENHAWNAIRLDGEYYFVDVTWDDPVGQAPDEVSHEYLNCDAAYFAADHEIRGNEFPIPDATGSAKNYYAVNGTVAELTVESIAAVIRAEAAAGRALTDAFEMRLSTAATQAQVTAFLNDNNSAFFRAVSEALGTDVSGMNYSLSNSGRILGFRFT